MGEERTLEQEVVRLRDQVAELQKGVHTDQLVRSISAHSPSNIILLDLDERIQYVNRTVPGVTPEELVGVRLLDIVEPEFHHGIISALARVREHQKPDRYETSYTSPSGDVSWWESSVGAMTQGTKVTGFVIVSTDTTERRRQTEEQERFFNLSVDMMSVAGFDGYFRRINQAFKAVLGYDNELLERPFLEFVHPEDVESTKQIFKNLLEGEQVVDFSNRYRAKNGRYRLLSWRSTADMKRQVIYAVASDVTDRRNLEEQLQQSRKMEAIGNLAGGVAHDFNNLLMAVQGNIELAVDDPAFAQAALTDAMSATQRAADLTRQLLTFSRSRSLSPVVLDLEPLLHNVMKLLARLLPENISVRVHSAKAVLPVLADPTQLEQVVLNLCVNARDAMPQGGHLKLDVQQVHIDADSPQLGSGAPGDYVVLIVSDTGSGISPEAQPHIFEPFFTTKPVGQGTGLGLSTVYGIVQQHGGFLEVESESAVGTTFRIYLPATKMEKARTRSAPPTINEGAKGGRETILVAEDDARVRGVVVRMLTQAGYEVLVAHDGLEAVRLFNNDPNRVALALLDVVMPNLGGLATAEQLRKKRPDLKVIFVSGHVQNPGDDARLQAETLLAKPYRKDDLYHRLRETLDAGHE